ncbi:MAG: hypothetical protein EAS52_05690, partial [Parapedobacter sp.]
ITELGQGDTVLQTEFLPGQTAVTPLDNKGEHVISTLFHILIILSVKLQQNNHSENMYLVGRIQLKELYPQNYKKIIGQSNM